MSVGCLIGVLGDVWGLSWDMSAGYLGGCLGDVWVCLGGVLKDVLGMFGDGWGMSGGGS